MARVPKLLLACATALSLEAGVAQAQEPETADVTIPRSATSSGTFIVEGREYEIHPATPTYGGDTGLFDLPSAYTLPKGKFSFSGYRTNLDRDPKDLDISIHGMSLAYGATSRLEIFGTVGFQNRIDADALFQPGFVNDYPLVSTGWETGLGDVRLGMKYKVLDDYEGQALGLALRGDVKLPTADEQQGLGTGKVSGGIALVLSKTLGYHADLHAAIGGRFNGDPDEVGIGNAVHWGVGLNVPALSKVQLHAELTGASYRGADFDQTKPLDLVVGPLFWVKGFFVRPAISWNLNFNDRGLNSSARSYTGRRISIGYHPGVKAREVAVSQVQRAPNRPATVSCQADRATVSAGESVRWRATALDPDGDALRYTWTISTGRIAGEGPEVVTDTTGIVAPATLTATVAVDDGRGGGAQARCQVRIEPAKAQVTTTRSVSCVSAGFPRNLARLNNVDKACLDDVAVRMRQDPRSTLLIKGHAEAGERYPEVLARKRAEAAKDYLVTERKVEASRIVTRSAVEGVSSTTRPGAGRSVEVIFAPEDTALPEP